MHLIDDRDVELDANFSIEADGTNLALIVESRSGRPSRNPDYNPALTVLLTRLGMLNAVLVDALVDSAWTRRKRPAEEDRRLIEKPILLPGEEPDAKALRIRLADAQAKVAANPERSKAGGTKRIRLRVAVPGYGPADAARLSGILAAPIAESSAGGITYSPVKQAEEAVEDAAGKRAQRGGGQGFQLDQQVKLAVEAHAMSAAIEFYHREGWEVEDVHGSESYDLVCHHGDKVKHVEVKGTTTDGAEVILTRLEVEHARDYGCTALFVLSNIDLKPDENGIITATGGVRHPYDPWRLDDGTLTPIGFRYHVPAPAD